MDSFFFGACISLYAHFDSLAKTFDGDKKKFILRHMKLLELGSELGDLMRPIIFSNFLISSLLLCVQCFQLVLHDDTVKRIIAASFASSAVIQLFVLCLAGQMLADISSSIAELSDRFYETDRDLVIIMSRSQNPVKITAWFFEVSLPTLSTMINASGSLVTMLKSFV